MSHRRQPSDFEVVVYTRADCPLCDDAIVELSKVGFNPTLVDIDADTRLRELYDRCVPVVEIDGRVRFRGRVHPMLLRRLITGTSLQEPS